MPCVFGFVSHPRSEACVQPNGLLGVAVTIRWRSSAGAASWALVRPTLMIDIGIETLRRQRTLMRPPRWL